MLFRLAGMVLGSAAAWFLAMSLPLGLGFALAGPAFAIVLLLTALLAERFSPRRRLAGPRSASLEVRRIRDYLPRWASFLAAAGSVFLIVFLASTTAIGSTDDQGRPGRAFTHTCGEYTQMFTPWPGSFYAVPVLIASGICLALTVIALREVVLRPRLSPDDSTRRRASEVIVAAYGIAVLTPLAGALEFATGIGGQTSCNTVGPTWITYGGGFFLVAVVVVWIYMAKTLLWSSRA